MKTSADVPIPVNRPVSTRSREYATSVFWWGNTDPSYPGALVPAKRDLPRGLQRLEELIGLEKCTDGQGVDEAEGDEEEEDVRGRRRGRGGRGPGRVVTGGWRPQARRGRGGRRRQRSDRGGRR